MPNVSAVSGWPGIYITCHCPNAAEIKKAETGLFLPYGPQRRSLAFPAFDLATDNLQARSTHGKLALSAYKSVPEKPLFSFRKFYHALRIQNAV